MPKNVRMQVQINLTAVPIPILRIYSVSKEKKRYQTIEIEMFNVSFEIFYWYADTATMQLFQLTNESRQSM